MSDILECGACGSTGPLRLESVYPAGDGRVCVVLKCLNCGDEFGRDRHLAPPLGEAEEDQHCVACGDFSGPFDSNMLCGVCSVDEREPEERDE